MDIHKGRGNANKIMNRLLLNLSKDLKIEIASVDGGSLRNAIPRESVSIITVSDAATLKKQVQNFEKIVKEEYGTTDPKLAVSLEDTETPSQVFNADFQYKSIQIKFR